MVARRCPQSNPFKRSVSIFDMMSVKLPRAMSISRSTMRMKEHSPVEAFEFRRSRARACKIFG